MQPDATRRLYHPSADLEKTKPERPHLNLGELRLARRLLDRRHQYRSRHMEEQTKLIGNEPVAARPAREQVQLELLDPVLGIATAAIEVIRLAARCLTRLRRPPGHLEEVGHNVARVQRVLRHLYLGNHRMLAMPCACLVIERVE